MKKVLLLSLFLMINVVFSQNKKENQLLYNELLAIDVLSKSKDKNIDFKLNQILLKLKKNESDSLKGFYFMIRANTFSDQLKKEEAIIAVKNAYSYYKNAENELGMSKSLMNLGNLYLYKGDF